MSELKPREQPCPTCPYLKLVQYDRDTPEQPAGVFMCHVERDDVTMCRGWLDCHEKHDSLALRLAVFRGDVNHDVFDLPDGPIECFASGADAAEHGLKDIDRPGRAARRAMNKIGRKIGVIQ